MARPCTFSLEIYTVESATLGTANAWAVLAENILATNYFLTLQNEFAWRRDIFRVSAAKRGSVISALK